MPLQGIHFLESKPTIIFTSLDFRCLIGTYLTRIWRWTPPLQSRLYPFMRIDSHVRMLNANYPITLDLISHNTKLLLPFLRAFIHKPVIIEIKYPIWYARCHPSSSISWMMHRDQALQQCLQSVQSKVPLPNNLTWRRRQMSKMAMSGYTHTYVHRPRYETEVLNWLVHGVRVRVLNLVNISTDPVNSHLSFHWEVFLWKGFCIRFRFIWWAGTFMLDCKVSSSLVPKLLWTLRRTWSWKPE